MLNILAVQHMPAIQQITIETAMQIVKCLQEKSIPKTYAETPVSV